MNLYTYKDKQYRLKINIKKWNNRFLYLVPSVYVRPFLSVRWLCFELTFHYAELNTVQNGAVRINK